MVPGAKENKVEDFKSYIKVRTTVSAEKGKANKSLIKQLSEYYHVPQKAIKIIQGTKLRKKIVEIEI